jgi:hypothetical protein
VRGEAMSRRSNQGQLLNGIWNAGEYGEAG